MTQNENTIPPHEMMLYPHQQAFVELVFDPATHRVVLLSHDVGLGSHAASVATVRCLLVDIPNARVLHIAPAGLQEQLSFMLNKAGVPVLNFDRYRFREIADSRSDAEPIPCGIAVATSIDFARQSDIRDFLASVHWDLVVVFEAQVLVGLGKMLIERLDRSADRFILTVVRGIKPPTIFADDETTFVEWRKEELVDREGKPLLRAPVPAMHRVTFPPDLGSDVLRAALEDLGQLLSQGASAESSVQSLLFRSAGSSPAAMERFLRGIVGRRRRSDVEAGFAGPFDEDPVQNVREWSADEIVARRAATIALRGLYELQRLESDPKLDVFLALMESLCQGQADRRICVVTELQDTLFYVVAGLEDRGFSVAVLHGGLSAEERFGAYRAFTHERNVMVATRSLIQDESDSIEIADLVFYEVPPAEETMQRIIAHSDRVGRESQLNVHVLAPES